MKDEDKEYMRNFAAMFALNALLVRGRTIDGDIPGVVEEAFDYADAFMTACDWRGDSGIAAIKPKKRYERKA